MWRAWCVGVCLHDGRHRFKVFDDKSEAENYAAWQKDAEGFVVNTVHLWEL